MHIWNRGSYPNFNYPRCILKRVLGKIDISRECFGSNVDPIFLSHDYSWPLNLTGPLLFIAEHLTDKRDAS